MTDDEFFGKFNINPNMEQKQAILHKDGSALVLAGPGSGKTTVITARCARLVSLMNGKEIKAGGILTMAFNRAAAKEMKERYEKVFNDMKPLGKQVDFSTFHSFCNSTIYRYESINNIRYERLSERSEGICKEKILDTIYSDINNTKLTGTEINKMANELGKMKNKTGADFFGTVIAMSNFKNLDKVFESYEQYKKENMYIDFDDMLYMAKDILTENCNVLKEIQSKYLYIQVDEGQDMSEIQLDILKILSKNVFIVGDDDQGIYGFRGATPKAIVNIKEYFSGCSIYYLKQNYRSTENIINSSDKFIKQNTVRFDKEFITNQGKGKKPKCKLFADDRELMAFMHSKIKSTGGEKCGILYRNGASSVIPMIMCVKNDIPCKISGGRGRFFESFVTQDILDMFMYERNSKSIFQRHPENILREFFINEYLEHMQYKCEKLSLRYEDMLRYASAWDYLTKGMKNTDQVIDLYNKLKNYSPDEQYDFKVHMSTIHSAKGLEYDTVFMIDLYKGEFPKNCDEEELQEERRLFYVGMTRAKKNLYMMYPSKRLGEKLEEGEFFKTARSL